LASSQVSGRYFFFTQRYRLVEPSPPPTTLLRYRILGALVTLILSMIGKVVVGGLLAGAQAIAMAGVPVAGQIIGGVVAGVMGIVAAFRRLF
jgi:hypothetical protein